MILSEKHYQILEALEEQEISTQRQLADFTGTSLGQINYVLKHLLSNGLVKIGNFCNDPSRIGHSYLLTQKGVEEKSKLAARFLISKLKEYNIIRNKMAEKLIAVSKNSSKRIIFVGPEIAKEFIKCIIYEKTLDLVMVAHCEDFNDIKKYDVNSFDLVVVLNTDQARDAAGVNGISSDMVVSLW